MFIDHASIMLRSGKGGDGCVSFHTAKYIPNGGPDGGNGGRGGHVYFEGDENMRTLQDFRYKRKFFAENGDNGQKAKRTGKSGEDLVIKVPLGTLISEKENGRLLADITQHGQRVLLLRGGRGGTGNTAYATPTRQAPRFAKAGEAGIFLEVQLELKLLADVAIIGMPNVGKSTYLSVVTRAKPEIANYHFTTIQPKVGIAQIDEYSFALADIPGLIEGASEGAGLGHDFLRHIERSRLLLHILDAAGSEGRDPYEDFCMINKELRVYSPKLSERPQIVALNKIDMADEAALKELRDKLEAEGYEVHEICAPIHEGTQELLRALADKLRELPAPEAFVSTEAVEYKAYELDDEGIKITRDETGARVVQAPWIDRFMRSINFDDYDSMHYFQRTLKRRGVFEALEQHGIKAGEPVCIGDFHFDYIPDDDIDRYDWETGELLDDEDHGDADAEEDRFDLEDEAEFLEEDLAWGFDESELDLGEEER